MLAELTDLAAGCVGTNEKNKLEVSKGEISLSPRLAHGFRKLCDEVKIDLKDKVTETGGGGLLVPCPLLAKAIDACPKGFLFPKENEAAS